MHETPEHLRPFPRNFCRLRHKATGVLTAAVLGAAGLSAALYIRLTNTTVRDEVAGRAREVAHTIAVAATESLKAGNRNDLLAVAEELIADRDVCYVAFADPAGRVIAGAQQGKGHLSRLLHSDGISISVATLDQPMHVTIDGERRIDVTVPMFPRAASSQPEPRDPVVGYARIGLSLADSDRQVAAVTRSVAVVAVLIAMLMIPLGFALMKRMTAPLGDLCDATRALAAGQLDRRVNADRPDEIGDLATAFNAMAQDLSRSRNELLSLNSELEDRVLARTFQLSEVNRQLRQEMAEKDDFLRTVTHDLNAPLRNVTGMIGLLRQADGPSPLSEGAAAMLDRIDHNVKHELSLIEELLELSHIRSRREVHQRVSLDAEVRAIFERLRFELSQKNIAAEIVNPLPPVFAERSRMRQLFQNLVDNAIKYTDPTILPAGDQPSIRIDVCERPDAFEFRIADRGIGIDPRDRDRVFYVFRRAKNGFVARTPGKGVGLANCKCIIQNYNGRIWVEPNPQGGSVFCFTLAKSRLTPSPDRESTTPVATTAAGPEVET